MKSDAALDYVFSLAWKGSNWGLKRVHEVLRRLGNPHEKFLVVCVTGTNGKGSTTKFLSSILEAAGFCTGAYYSPHVLDPRERIQVNSSRIPKKDFSFAFKKVFSAVNQTPAVDLTLFEFLTCIALVHFERRKVGCAVLETGLGGRLDATNVGTQKAVVITNVGLEHTQILGRTVAEIAREKAGLICKNCIAVTDAKGAALSAIRRVARRESARLLTIDGSVCISNSGSVTLFSIGRRRLRAKLLLKGAFQQRNAACALLVARNLPLKISDKAMEAGLARARLPGRLEVVKRRPLVVMDCAHNPPAAEQLATAIPGLFKQKPVLVFGAMKDKSYSRVFGYLAPLVKSVVFCKPCVSRAEDAFVLARMGRKCGLKSFVVENSKKAIALAEHIAGSNGGVLVTGSIYLLAEARGSCKYVVGQ